MTDLLQAFPDVIFLALDQLKLNFQATLTRVWFPRGQTPVVKVSPQREVAHFSGALELRSGREVAVPAPRQCREVTADFIRLLLLLFPQPHILLLLDRASWHFGPLIDQLLDENPRLELMYFPPACPDLNPQEHVWNHAREAISHNHSYRSFQPLVDDFETFLNDTPFQTDFLDQYAPTLLCNL